MAMSIQIDLPDDLQSFVSDRTRAGGHPSPSEFIVALIRDEQFFRALKERADALDRGEGRPMTEQDWADIRETVRAKLAANRTEGCPT